jgi:Zn-dependent protease
MDLGPFALLSAFYILLGVRVIYQLARNFRQTFDLNFTTQDRLLVDQAAFFILLPISVALHECGHALAIHLFGGDVLGWGFYGFAGYVEFDPVQFTAAQRILIASAGTVVNLLLAALAVGIVFLKRPPLRAAVNELLIQFTWISLLNALVLYPILDFVGGLNGDWVQMYDGGVPQLSLEIFIIHLSILAVLFWAWRSPVVRARIAQLTGVPAGRRRMAISPRAGHARGSTETSAERTLREAAARVSSGWVAPVEAALQRGGIGTALVLSWRDDSLRRSVIAVAPDTGGIEFSGALWVDGQPPQQRPLGRDPAPPDADRLTMMLRLAMETVNGWIPPLDEPSAAPPAPTPTSAA